MKRKCIKASIIGLMLACTHLYVHPQAHAQQALSAQSKAPIEITADGSLEWHRADNKFIAQNNAQAKQGDTSINAQTLTAFYKEGTADENLQIQNIIAQNKVTIKSTDTTIYGQNATYNLNTGIATITGNNLKMTAPDQTLTARDKFEYFEQEGRINAIGNAKIIRKKPTGGSDTLNADKITATLKKDKNGKQALDTIIASGNVTIATPDEKITSNNGTYNAAANTATLTGNVKIIRGLNTLEGDRATIDLNTNISKIFANPKTTNKPKTRIRATFYPGSEKE